MASIRIRERKGKPPLHTVLWRDPQSRTQMSLSFPDPMMAENFRRIIEANGLDPDQAKATLAAINRKRPLLRQAIEEHIAGLPSVTARSRADYRRDADRHIYPTLGAIAVDDLTPASVKAWLQRLAETEMSDKSIANIHGLLSSSMNTATAAGYRPDNPCRGIRLPRRSEHTAVEMTFLTPAEWSVLDQEIGRIYDGHYQLFFRLMAGTGIRWGEATALRVGDLSLDTTPPTVRISRATRRDENSVSYTGPTKTKRSRRTISLPTKLAAALTEHVRGRPVDDLLFKSRTGAPVHHSNVRSRIWLPAVANARDVAQHPHGALVDAPRIHDLRHSHASWLISEGLDLLTVQRRLGHESVTTTADRYGHLMPGQQRAAVAALDSLFG